MRGKAYNRSKSLSKAKRKQRLAREIYPDGDIYPYYPNLHQYSKNKIHCSCPLCAAKTKNKGNSLWAPVHNYTISDQRKKERMDYTED